MSAEDAAAVFRSLAAGKVTIGVAECALAAEQLDLDIGPDMLESAWELVAESGAAGACGRLDAAQFTRFVRRLADR